MDQYQVLRIDLTAGTAAREDVPKEVLSSFIGGKGLAAHYLAKELPSGTDPLSPENLLIFMTGPISGIFAGSCRHAVVTKSPTTGGFLDTYAGGYWAWELRKAGLLGIIIQGQSDTLSYLEITPDGAEIKDGAHLAGLTIAEVDDHPSLSDFRVSAIGPAGENLVGVSVIGNNVGQTKKGRSGFNGRGGSGAVMGSKRLKAIAVQGGKSPAVSEEAKALRKEFSKKVQAKDSDASWLFDAGTPVIVEWTDSVNILPTRNWTSGSFEGSVEIGHEAVLDNLVSREGCFNCPVNCGQHVKAKKGAFPGAEADKVEYETIGLAASNTGNSDFSNIVKFSQLCDDLGLDTISTGAAVAFAMDCAERGIISDPIRFGDSEGQAKLTEAIAYKRGLGAVLANGIRPAADEWGVDDSEISVFEVKGLEFPAYDPRGSIGLSLAYATSDRGACHLRAWPAAYEALSDDEDADPFGTEGKAEAVIGEQDDNSAEWSLVGCDFVVFNTEDACQMLNSLGIQIGEDEYRQAGKRIWNLVRLFNLEQGWTAADDSAPEALRNPLEDSGRSLDFKAFETMKEEYYQIRGWDKGGRPTPELIRELGLENYPVAR